MNTKILWEVSYNGTHIEEVARFLADDIDTVISLFEQAFKTGPEQFQNDRFDIIEIKKIGRVYYA